MYIEEIEYRYFLQYGKYLNYFYQQYRQAEFQDNDIEKGIVEIQRLVEEERYQQIKQQIQMSRKSKRCIPIHDYPDFNKLIHWSFTLSKLSFIVTEYGVQQRDTSEYY